MKLQLSILIRGKEVIDESSHRRLGDIVAYRCAAVNENAEEGLAAWQTDQLLSRILEDINASDWSIYLSGENNFRYKIYPEYKANRRELPRPRHLEFLRGYIITDWNGRIINGMEADDQLGIESQRTDQPCVICSIDKDLLQVPGRHYNFVQRKVFDVSETEAIYNFYYQVLVGDPTDNIKGCPGVGKVKAGKLLGEPGLTESELFDVCLKAYKDSVGETDAEKLMLLNGQLLWILREEEGIWNFPTQPQLMEAPQS